MRNLNLNRRGAPDSGCQASTFGKIMHTKDRAKIARIIQSGSYFSAMNNSKWQKLANAFGDGVRARVKLITEDELDEWHVMTLAASDKYLDGSSYGPVPFLEIEWIDIAIDYDNSRFIDALNAIGDLKLPHDSIEDFIRVFGHVAPGTHAKYSAEQAASSNP